MRFRQLHLEKYGRFTGLVREFKRSSVADSKAGGASDLHIIFGPNEAGKSSFLRAIRALLYGIPSSSTDNFVHQYSSMRISADIENKLGENLTFTRRKGNKGTILGADGKALDDLVLDDYLGQADLGFFNRVCGLGTAELAAGSEELQKGEGELGKALFGATVGSSRLKNALESLEAQAAELYKPRGSETIIGNLLKRRKEALDKLNKSIIPPADINDAQKTIDELTGEKDSLNIDIGQVRKEQLRIEKFERAYTTLEELKSTEQILLAYTSTPDVDDGFVERARLAKQKLDNQIDGLTKVTSERGSTQLKFAQYDQAQPILEDEDSIQDAYRNLNAVLKNQQALKEAEHEHSSVEHRIQRQLADLDISDTPIESLDRFRLKKADRLQFKEASEELERTAAVMAESTASVERIKQASLKLEAKEPDDAAVDVEQLRSLLLKAREAKRINQTVTTDAEAAAKLERMLASLHANLPGAPASYEKTVALRMPRSETISEYQNSFNTLETKLTQYELDHDAARDSLAATQLELNGILEKHGLLASVDELHAAREKRDTLWLDVLASWKGGSKEQSVGDVPLADAYPHWVLSADKISDVLRQDADVAAQVIAKQNEQSKYEQRLSDLEAKRLELRNQFDKEQQRWCELWAALDADTGAPSEMAAWRAEWIRFCDSYANHSALCLSLESLKKQVLEATEQLQDALQADPHAELDTLIDASDKRITDADEHAGAEKERRIQIAEFKQELELAVKALQAAKLAHESAVAKWQACCKTLDFPSDHSTRVVGELLEAREALLSDFDSWSKNQNLTIALSSTVKEYESNAIDLANKCGIESATLKGRVENLHTALEEAKAYSTKKESLRIQLLELETAVTSEEKLMQAATLFLSGLVQQLKLPSMDGIESLLDEIDRKAKPVKDQRELQRRLLILAGGEEVDLFRAEVEKRDAAELDAEKSGLKQQENQLNARRDDVLKELTTAQVSFDVLSKESSEAISQQQLAMSLTAEIETSSQRYVRLLMSIDFLKEQIAAYRAQHQGPLLNHASDNFKQLTADEFTHLSVEYNDKDERMLVGVRQSGEPIGLSAMSDGTRDQLYLALRLAALDQHMSSHEPLPLVIDDLLITFDDGRAVQMLKLLMELSTRTQIFVLTHHQHIVDLCKNTLDADHFQVHSLGDG